MSSLSFEKTTDQLDDIEIADSVTAFYRVQAAGWLRRQLAVSMPKVKAAVLAARAKGDRPDVLGIIRKVHLKHEIPMLEIE